ncbi:MAG: diaminopropionate ammonia-lyase [Chloroflexota bacterium]
MFYTVGMGTPYYHNKGANAFVAPVTSDIPGALAEFHRRLPGYVPTPLVEAKVLARQLGVSKLWVKNESSRLGLPSFKILGASWATYNALSRLPGMQLRPWEHIADLADQLSSLRPLTLVAATDGNHGRAVARMAALLGLKALIFVPDDMAPARLNAIGAEGARVVRVNGSYDDAVRLSAEAAGPSTLLISDTSWPGYEQTPRDVIAGYSTIFREIDAEVEGRDEGPPDLVIVQMGVGALAGAVVQHYRSADISDTGRRPQIVGVEPLGADCILQSMLSGRITEVPGPHHSIMAGLNCGLPSEVAWPLVSGGIDLFLAIGDERSRQAMRALAREGITSGETGAAGVGGLIELLSGEQAELFRSLLGISETSNVLAISTEGATDPTSYQAILADVD